MHFIDGLKEFLHRPVRHVRRAAAFRALSCCVLLLAPLAGRGQQLSIIPKPAFLEPRPGSFMLDAGSFIAIDPADSNVPGQAEWFARLARAGTGLPLPILNEALPPRPQGQIRLALDPGLLRAGNEGYRLTVERDRIEIRAFRSEGILHGLQSLRQLLPPSVEHPGGVPGAPIAIPCLAIEDIPRYAWRGMHLDVSRHFFPPSFIRKYLDLMSLYKMNVFHWHLTDDQGWRIDIKRYPRLAAISSRRAETEGDGVPYGGIYTQEEIRGIVAYARDRGITVVPEIDIPGHVTALLAAFPEISCTGGPFEVATRWGVFDDVLCVGNEKTYEVIRNILAEVSDLFPSPVIHVGGDEAPKTRWRACPKCLHRMAISELSDVNRLPSYFFSRVAEIAASFGKRIAGWDEMLQGGAPEGATITAWQSVEAGYDAARRKHEVVMSPTDHCYLNLAQAAIGEPPAFGLLTIDSVYTFEPAPAGTPDSVARMIAGVEGALWTEQIGDSASAEYMLLPRLCALSEVAWTPAARRDAADFTARLDEHYARLGDMGANARIPPPLAAASRAYFTGDTLVTFSSIPGGRARYTLDGSQPGETSPIAAAPLRISGDCVLTARIWMESGLPGTSAQTTFYRIDPLVNGVWYTYYEGNWKLLPHFDTLAPKRTGICYDLHLDALRHRQERFALRFSTFLFIDEAAHYTFTLRSNDGSRLEIDRGLIVDNDGAHGAIERSRDTFLDAGWHALALEYFDAGGGNLLEVYYERIGDARRPIHPRQLQRMNGALPDLTIPEPSALRLGTNYPNPFRDRTTIAFDLDRKQNIELVLFDRMGRPVREIYRGECDAGRWEQTLSVPRLASGTYFIRMAAASRTFIRPVTIAR